MIELIVILISGLGMVIGCEAIGRVVVRKLGLIPDEPFDSLSAGIGFFGLTAILLISGICHTFVPVFMIGLAILLVLIAVVRIIHFWVNKTPSEEEPLADELDWTLLLIRLVFPVLVSVFLLSVMTPETRHDPYDYHLTVPSLYLANSAIVEIPWHVFSYMPKNGELLYGFALGITHDSFARFIHFLFGWMCIWTLFAFLRRNNVSHRLAGGAAFLVATLALFAFIVTAAYIDLIRAFYELAALDALSRLWLASDERKKHRYFLIAALLAGMALGTKYVALAVFLPAFLCLALWAFIKKLESQRVVSISLFPMLLLLPLAPWLTYNWLWTGNPVYPLLPTIFGQHTIAAESAYQFFKGHAPPIETLLSWDIFPFLLMRLNRVILEGNSLVIMGIAALITLTWWRKSESCLPFPRAFLNGIVLFEVVSLFFYLVATDNHDGRFCFSSFALFAIPAIFLLAAIEEHLRQSETKMAPYFIPVIFTLMFIALLNIRYNQIQDQREPMIPIISTAARDQWLGKHFTQYHAVQWANQNLSKESCIIGMGYPLRLKHISGTKYGTIPFLHDLATNTSPDQLMQILRKNGVTHLVKPYPNIPSNVDFSILENGNMEPIYDHFGTTIYSLIPESKSQ